MDNFYQLQELSEFLLLHDSTSTPFSIVIVCCFCLSCNTFWITTLVSPTLRFASGTCCTPFNNRSLYFVRVVTTFNSEAELEWLAEFLQLVSIFCWFSRHFWFCWVAGLITSSVVFSPTTVLVYQFQLFFLFPGKVAWLLPSTLSFSLLKFFSLVEQLLFGLCFLEQLEL